MSSTGGESSEAQTPLSGTTRFFAWVGNNAIQQDAKEAEAKLRELAPALLQEGERIELAFKVEYNKFYFTTKRLLFKKVKGMTGLKINYRSIPYSSMRAYSVRTAGAYLDGDTELRIWTDMYHMSSVELNFVKDMVDIIAMKQFLNTKLLGPYTNTLPSDVANQPRTAVPAAADAPVGAGEGLLDLLGGDARQIDAEAVEQQLRSSPAILFGDEHVEMAFKCGRDSTLLTTKRILFIDVQGVSGKKIEYRSILWESIRAFSLQTSGAVLDRDSEMRIWTNMPSMKEIGQDFRKGKADILAIQRFMTNRVLGLSPAERSEEARGHSLAAPTGGDAQRMFQWLGDDHRQIDARAVDNIFHTAAPVLQPHEHVEMAFKGRRDMLFFTTKRLLKVDLKGWSGQKVQYLSIPWSTVQSFAVRSAGAVMDKDSEMMIWTDIMFIPGTKDDPPEPGMSYLEQDFRKDQVDLMAVHRYLSAKVLKASGGDFMDNTPIPVDTIQATPPGSVEKFLSFLGDDAHQIDAARVDEQLHTVNPMLQQDERVRFAFKSGRDLSLFTSKRFLHIDVQGWSGTKVEYLSVPYACIKSFAVQSAGAMDFDAEVMLLLRTPWNRTVLRDLRQGRADLMAVQAFLSAKVLDGVDAAVPAGLQAPPAVEDSGVTSVCGGLDGFVAWIGSDARQIDHREIDEKLHTSPPILQSDETVDMALKVGRDMFLFTTKRMISVNVKGITGMKVMYHSVPYKSCQAFSVQSAGKFDHDAEAYVWTDIPAFGSFYQDLWKGRVDIFDVQNLLASKILGR